jgi:hypothetical protein
VGAGVPEERAVRGHASDTGGSGAVLVQVLHCRATGTAPAFPWGTGDPDITLGWPEINLLFRVLLASSRFIKSRLL